MREVRGCQGSLGGSVPPMIASYGHPDLLLFCVSSWRIIPTEVSLQKLSNIHKCLYMFVLISEWALWLLMGKAQQSSL